MLFGRFIWTQVVQMCFFTSRFNKFTGCHTFLWAEQTVHELWPSLRGNYYNSYLSTPLLQTREELPNKFTSLFPTPFSVSIVCIQYASHAWKTRLLLVHFSTVFLFHYNYVSYCTTLVFFFFALTPFLELHKMNELVLVLVTVARF